MKPITYGIAHLLTTEAKLMVSWKFTKAILLTCSHLFAIQQFQAENVAVERFFINRGSGEAIIWYQP